jgi:hypothetical protein
MASDPARAQLACEQLAMARAARRASLRRVIAHELAIWAPLIHRREAELATALNPEPEKEAA